MTGNDNRQERAPPSLGYGEWAGAWPNPAAAEFMERAHRFDA